MKVTPLSIPDVLLLAPKVYEDDRGFFYESFNENTFKSATGCETRFLQDSHSCSSKNVIRGLHYQLPPYAQGKLIRVIKGAIFDVLVDIRKNSETFGQWTSATLSAANKNQIWVPEGFAHGFMSLEENTEVLYKSTNVYSPDHERSIVWDDKDIGIEWPVSTNVIITEKDKLGQSLNNADLFE